jgi:hypothetical protein
MRSFRLVGDGFDNIKLIKKAAARWNLAEVLGFIDHDRDGPAIADSLLHGVSVLCADRPRGWHEAHSGGGERSLRLSTQLMVDQWLVKLVKETFVMVAPVKTPGLGSYCFLTDDWNPRAVFAKFA